MKERFTTEEWTTLERLPVMVFLQVAGADGTVQDEESAKFIAEMLDAANWRDPLLRELLSTLATPQDFADAFESSVRMSTTSAGAVVHEIEAAKNVLQDKLRDVEYHRFVFSLLGLAGKVAEAHAETKKRRFRHKKEQPATSESEANVIGLLTVMFEFDPERAREGFEELQHGTPGPGASGPLEV